MKTNAHDPMDPVVEIRWWNALAAAGYLWLYYVVAALAGFIVGSETAHAVVAERVYLLTGAGVVVMVSLFLAATGVQVRHWAVRELVEFMKVRPSFVDVRLESIVVSRALPSTGPVVSTAPLRVTTGGSESLSARARVEVVNTWRGPVSLLEATLNGEDPELSDRSGGGLGDMDVRGSRQLEFNIVLAPSDASGLILVVRLRAGWGIFTGSYPMPYCLVTPDPG